MTENEISSLMTEHIKTYFDSEYMNYDLYKLLVGFNNDNNNKVLETTYKDITLAELELGKKIITIKRETGEVISKDLLEGTVFRNSKGKTFNT